MRLHRLEVQAFQAFAGRESVDFDALSDAGLFLLHGDTGAGKTTLLDAVCFALYGKLPGARGGNDARVRSDHAARDVRTEVLLEATLRGERIRILRTPKQERPSLRGDKLVEDAATVLVESIDGEGAARVLAARPDEAGAELERLLGMTREQFCQVVLLPQGEFATFLRADSDERAPLLERIFATGRFRDAETWMRRRQQATAERARDAQHELRDVVTGVVAVVDEVEAPERWEEDPAALTGWLDETCVVVEAQLATASEHAAERERAQTEAQRAFAAVEELAARRVKHAAAVRARAAHDGLRGERTAHAAELEQARAAVAVAPLVAALDDAVRAATQAFARVAALGVEATPQEAGALRVTAAELRRRAGAVGELRATEAGLRERAAARDADERALAQARSAEREAGLALGGAAERREALATAVDQAKAAAGALGPARDAGRDAQARLEAAGRRDRARAALTELEERLAAAVGHEQDARQRWLDLREARLTGMAAELAGGLVDGEPCAVCGSVDHPTPARPAGGAVVSADDETAAQTAHDERRAARETLEGQCGGERSALAAAVAVAGETPTDLLAAAADQAREDLVTIERAATGLEEAERALATHDAAIAEHERARGTAVEAAARLEGTLAGLRVEVDGARRALAASLDGAATVDERVGALEAQAERADGAATAVDAALAAHAAEEQARTRAGEAARGAGFSDLSAARSAARDPEAREALEGAIRAFDGRESELRALAADPALAAAANAPEPDVDAASGALVAAMAAASDAAGTLAVVRRQATTLHELRVDLAVALDAFGPLAEEAARVSGLAQLLEGQGPHNRKKMRLSAYVLAARLEEIAAAASMRLDGMTDGRYVLVHRDTGSDGRKKAGLGLAVIDAWTGRERSPRSLSGGETFLASLALALGLADVVAAESGGARLETLFVDEGFGTLDEATLDEVLDVLDRLRAGGRVVGIVSHVPELRQRVAARLHVVKGREGSHVEQTELV